MVVNEKASLKNDTLLLANLDLPIKKSPANAAGDQGKTKV
jgi:hypothetical protein